MILHQSPTSIHSMYQMYFQGPSSRINTGENKYTYSGNLGLTLYSSDIQPQYLNPYIVEPSAVHNQSEGNLVILF